ncbi:hypothetical protein VPH35_124469 [Triticum aestivum]|uniref:Uncharacterized protein n=1 Tax=Triticum urartu TaxID=4572 RepID=A0A8R7R5L1_TRIUA
MCVGILFSEKIWKSQIWNSIGRQRPARNVTHGAVADPPPPPLSPPGAAGSPFLSSFDSLRRRRRRRHVRARVQPPKPGLAEACLSNGFPHCCLSADEELPPAPNPSGRCRPRS